MHERGTKTTPVFYLLMEIPLDHYFQIWSPFYQERRPNLIPFYSFQNWFLSIAVSSRCQVRSEKAKKGQALTLITAATSTHLPQPVSTDLTIKPDLVLTNPKGKDWVRIWLM